ncbi:SDR family oxidoreductase [Actinoplanes sp. NPDC051494]|uniref:SDR family oxidoreductase n=1 Tax=Actinoplanes sp. NPDC051494 TaxID=3363907 RepID=UPI0037B3080F
MRVFVTGASGFIGSAIVAELIRHDHQVIGLVRSSAAAEQVRALGATPHLGSIEDLDSIRAGAARAEGAIHTAFFHKFTHASLRTRLRVILGGDPRATPARFMGAMLKADRTTIETIGTELSGPDRPLVAAFGTLALAPGRLGTEDDEPDPTAAGGARGATERTMLDLASRGIRSSVVRLAPTVHGDGDQGFIAQMVAAARKHGVASYAGDGRNRWPAVHRLDAARLFVQALEKGEAGARYHGVAEEGIPLIDTVTAVGRRAGVPAASASPKELQARLGFMAPFLGADNIASSALTRSRLGWEPVERTLLDDIEHGTYG